MKAVFQGRRIEISDDANSDFNQIMDEIRDFLHYWHKRNPLLAGLFAFNMGAAGLSFADTVGDLSLMERFEMLGEIADFLGEYEWKLPGDKNDDPALVKEKDTNGAHARTA